MAATITTIDELQKYLRGVRGRAEHHAKDVKQVVLALAGALICFKDKDSEIEVRTTDGELKNVLWAFVGGRRYTFSYNHDDATVAIRQESLQGDEVASFNNETTLPEIVQTFKELRSRG